MLNPEDSNMAANAICHAAKQSEEEKIYGKELCDCGEFYGKPHNCRYQRGLGHLQQAQPERAPLICTWTQDSDYDMGDTYASACGELWSFIDGGPQENRVRFCQGCGGAVKLAPTGVTE